VILLASRAGFEADRARALQGPATSAIRLLALAMMMLMFSTAGVPPFVGFWAKLQVIQALLGLRAPVARPDRRRGSR
jgi:NADH-quinone oxidoreductase subunit N